MCTNKINSKKSWQNQNIFFLYLTSITAKCPSPAPDDSVLTTMQFSLQPRLKTTDTIDLIAPFRYVRVCLFRRYIIIKTKYLSTILLSV